MPERECEECGAKVDHGRGLCTECGWENDLKYFVDIAKTRTGLLSPEEAGYLLEREKWETSIWTICLGLGIALFAAAIGLGISAHLGWFIYLGVLLILLPLHTLGCAWTIWLASDSTDEHIKAEGGREVFWGKSLGTALISQVTFCVLAVPLWLLAEMVLPPWMQIVYFWEIWTLFFLGLGSVGWLGAILFLFEFRFLKAVIYTGAFWMLHFIAMGVFIESTDYFRYDPKRHGKPPVNKPKGPPPVVPGPAPVTPEVDPVTQADGPVKPKDEPVKPENEPVESEGVKPDGEPVKPDDEPVKPDDEPAKPDDEPPAAEIERTPPDDEPPSPE